MRNVEFAKKCEAGKLHAELVAAGFDIDGVSTIDSAKENKVIVHLKDTETKDPAPIVEAHIYERLRIKPINIQKIVQKLIDKKIISGRSEVER